MDTEGQGSTSGTRTSATATVPKEEEGIKGDKTAVVSGEVCESIKKGMRIISDIEKTRADGMVFKFELDLMYAVRKRRGRERARVTQEKAREPTAQPRHCTAAL